MFVNPVDPKSHMAMLCYKNGSLAREAVRNRVADRSWEKFDGLIAATPVGNEGNIGFFIDQSVQPLWTRLTLLQCNFGNFFNQACLPAFKSSPRSQPWSLF
jgi:hypothetical protein